MDPFLGEIRLFAGFYAPEGWMFCDGSTVSVNEYQALYALIGNTFGGTSGVNFNLPTLVGRTPVGQGQLTGGSNYVLAALGGVSQVTLTEANLPAHTHTFTAANVAASSPSPSGNMLAISNGTGGTYSFVKRYTPLPIPNGGATAPNVQFDPNAINASTGAGGPHNNQQPYVAINFIICMNGLFPTPSS